MSTHSIHRLSIHFWECSRGKVLLGFCAEDGRETSVTRNPFSTRRLFTVTNVAAGVCGGCGGGYGRSGFFQLPLPSLSSRQSTVRRPSYPGKEEKRASVLSRPAEETLAINNNNLNSALRYPSCHSVAVSRPVG